MIRANLWANRKEIGTKGFALRRSCRVFCGWGRSAGCFAGVFFGPVFFDPACAPTAFFAGFFSVVSVTAFLGTTFLEITFFESPEGIAKADVGLIFFDRV